MEFKRIPVEKNFYLDEFLPPSLYYKYSANLAAEVLDPRIYKVVQFLRDEYGKPIFANNWYAVIMQIMKKHGLSEFPQLVHAESFAKKYGRSDDFFDERCVRNPSTSTGAPKSRHKFEKNIAGTIIRRTDAIDLDFFDMTGSEAFEWMKPLMPKLYDMGVRRMEDTSITPNWNHIDFKEHKLGKGIQIFDLSNPMVNFIRL